MSYTYTIDSKLPTLNEYVLAERTNKFIAANIKKKSTEACMWYCKHLKGKLDLSVKYDIHFEWHMQNRKLDPDNVCYAKKPILDGLVKAGALDTDGAKRIHGFRDTFIYDGKNFTVVTLIPIQ